MAAGNFNLGKASGGILNVSPADGTTNTSLVLPASGTVVATDVNGNLGLGVSTATLTGAADKAVHIHATTESQLHLTNTTTGNTSSDGSVVSVDSSGNLYLYNKENANTIIGTNNIERMRIDVNGNIGIGVTPSAWRSPQRVIELTGGAAIGNYGGQDNINVSANTYTNSSNSPVYKNNGYACSYIQASGIHQWFTAPSGTAGNAIAWTNAMTLNSSGYLYFGGDIADATTTGIRRGSAGQLILRASSSGLYQQANTDYYLVTTAGGSTSDITLKKDIELIPNSLNKILNLKGVYYEFIEEQLCTADKGKQIGVIAQDVEQEFPEIVLTNEDGIKTVRYDRLIAPMIEAIKEQQAIINDLKARIEILEGAK